jgi:hypothetical protein
VKNEKIPGANITRSKLFVSVEGTGHSFWWRPDYDDFAILKNGGKTRIRTVVSRLTGARKSLHWLHRHGYLYSLGVARGKVGAANLATEWYAQDLVFDGYVERKSARKKVLGKKVPSKVAQYRIEASYELVPVAGAEHCVLKVGKLISVPGTVDYGSSADRWDELGRQIERDCDIFHQLAASTSPNTLQDDALIKPAKAVEDARREAKRLRSIGQNLSVITGPDEATLASIERAWSALLEMHALVRQAIGLIADIQLSMPSIFPNLAALDGLLDLRAIAEMAKEGAAKEA